MKLAELLTPDSVFVIPAANSKKRLLQDISDRAQERLGIERDLVLQALLDREALGTTGVGQGVALPHARLPELDGLSALFIRLVRPVSFDSIDRRPVDLICALFAPEGAGVEHLKALALVSRTLRDPVRCSKLRSNSDPAILHTLLIDEAESQAA